MRIYLALLLLVFSSSSYAADYFWKHGDSSFTSPSLSAVVDHWTTTMPPVGPYVLVATKVTVNGANAKLEAWWDDTTYPGYDTSIPGTWMYSYSSASRFGDACPEGATYNAQTGECEGPEEDPCLSTVDKIIFHEHAFKNLNADGNPDSDPPFTVCDNACQYAFMFGDFTSKRDGKRPDQLLGAFKYKGNGVSCTTSSDPSNFDQPPSKAPMSPQQEYLSDDSCDQWVTNPDGTRSRSCVSTNYFNEPGNLNCGSMGGSYDCSVGKPPPYSKDTTTEQTTTETTNPDGSKNTSTNSNTSTTTCKGLSKCTTDSKTETEEQGTNPDGTPGDSSSTCTGSGCDKEEDEGREDEEQEEEPERTAGNTTCNGATAVVSCSGDAIDCAVLQEEANQSCMAKEQADFPGKKGDIESMFQGEQFTLQETTVTAPSFINASTRFLPSGCPAPKNVSLSSNGGHSFSFSYEPICQFASDMSWIIVAVASIFAAVYVGRAFGGE